MRNFVFILRDPGAYAAIYPVFLALNEVLSIKCKLFCHGTAAKMNPKFAANETDVQHWVDNHIREIDVLVCGTGFQTEPELAIMEEFQHRRILTVAILDYWSNYKRRFLFCNRVLWPDIYIVMDLLAAKEAVEEGVPKSIIRVLGHPGLDAVLRKSDEYRKANEGKIDYSRVLLLGEPMSGRTALGYDGEKFFSDCIEVLKVLNKNFSIKFHPRDDAELQEKYSVYRIDGDLLEIALQHDIVIGMTSIALLHCSLLGKTTISYQPGLACADGCISNILGLSKLIVSRETLLTFLSQPVFDRKKSPHDLIWLDGQSTERVVRFLMEIQ